jgi:hypothetical protein
VPGSAEGDGVPKVGPQMHPSHVCCSQHRDCECHNGEGH